MLGGAVGQFLRSLFPGWGIEPAAFALVGMGGFFAGVSKTPLTSIIMVCEMAGSYSLLVPLMLVCGLHLALSRHWTIYEEQVPSPVDSPAHLGDFVVDVLERIRVGQVHVRTEGLELVPEAMPFNRDRPPGGQLARAALSGRRLPGPAHGHLLASRRADGAGGLRPGPARPGRRPGPRPVVTVTPQDDLHTAMKRLTELNVDHIPVVSPDDPTHLIGLLSRRELVSAYTSQIEALRSPKPMSAS